MEERAGCKRANGLALSLASDNIDLWFTFYEEIPHGGTLERYRSLLTEAERLREAQFYFPQDRIRYLVTRALVRTVLSRYVGLEPERWRFEVNAFGRPSVANKQKGAGQISFNLSHTSSLIMLGVTQGHSLGVDTENVMRRKPPLDAATHYFSSIEIAALAELPPQVRSSRFWEYWTLKESYIKAKGTGLSTALNEFGFVLSASADINITFTRKSGDQADGWRFWQIQPRPEYLAAVCVQRNVCAPQHLTTRRIVPLESEEHIHCSILRKSNP
jgi:4'-phosphopantetheinyl transferase